jgi:hypothetical protein
MKILLGVIGAVLGFVAALVLLELGGFGNKADPIMSGLIALFVVGPIGAIAGAVLGTKLAMKLRREQDATAAGSREEQPEGARRGGRPRRHLRHALLCVCRLDGDALAQPERGHAGAAVRNPPCSRGWRCRRRRTSGSIWRPT